MEIAQNTATAVLHSTECKYLYTNIPDLAIFWRAYSFGLKGFQDDPLFGKQFQKVYAKQKLNQQLI